MQAKKWMVIGSIVAVALVAAILVVPMAFAQGPATGGDVVPGRGSMMNNGLGTNYGMGMNNAPSRLQQMGMRQQAFMQGPGNGSGFVDEDGDGVCDTCGNGSGQGRGFVDDDGDGVCDHAGTGQQGARRGRGMGRWTQ